MRLFKTHKKNGEPKSLWSRLGEGTTFAVSLIAIITAIINFNSWSTISKIKEVEHLVYGYFDASMRRDFDELFSFYNFPMVRFYDLPSPDKEEVLSELQRYYENWKFQRISIVQNSIETDELENGNQRVRLILDYQTKRNKEDRYKNFDLEIFMLLNSDNKVVSIYEMQN